MLPSIPKSEQGKCGEEYSVAMDPGGIKNEKCELTTEALEYLQQLRVEKENIDPSYAIACRLMNEGESMESNMAPTC